MSRKAARQRKTRNRTRFIERLEDRRVMSADPISQLLGGSPSWVSDQSIAHHGVSIAHHSERDADFWIDLSTPQDPATLAGNIEQMLASAHTLSGLTQVRNNYGFIGSGQTVAIIDSGIAWNHAALGGGLGANFRVVGGWDFTEENDSNPYDDGPEGAHGTHVAGIVGADRTGTADDGVAPGVDLVGLRVFNDIGDGWFSWVENALQWVHQNRNAFENPITAVNLSLGTAWNSNSVPGWSTLENEFAQLNADGIFVSVSAGNSFTDYNVPGLSYPAASPHVVPVMSVDDSGGLSYFSQRHTRAIAAPGRMIVSTVPDYAGNNNGLADDFASFSGTSMAAPYVAGASVLLRQAMQFLGYTGITQDTIFNHMMSTADTFFDPATNTNYKRLNLASAFNALMPADEYGSSAAAAYNLGTISGQSTVNGLIGTLSDADYFRFTAATTGTISFTASTSHGLAPVWTGSGGTGSVSGANGQTYTFEVVAGQQYSLGLSTSGGIGWYTLTVNSTTSGPNSAPELQPIGNRTVMQGTRLSFTATAVDPDAGQQLRYGLNDGPTGASIHPITGAFSWTPNASQGPGTYTMTVWVIDDQTPFLHDLETFQVTVTPPPPAEIRYLSASTDAWLSSTDGSWLYLANADIAEFAVSSVGHQYAMHFNGADAGLTTATEGVDAFTFLPDGSILISTVGAYSVSSEYYWAGWGTGSVLAGGGEDVLRFTPITLGDYTTGTWSVYLDGSDVGLTSKDENIDALSVLSDGRVIISTFGRASVPGVTAEDEDLLAFTPWSLGANSWGTWAHYFDGSDVGLTATGEDIDALFVGEWSANPELFFSTRGNYAVNGNAGANEDMFSFRPLQLGSNTVGTFMSYKILDGSNHGLAGLDVDGFYFGAAPGTMSMGSASMQAQERSMARAEMVLAEALREFEPAGAMGSRSIATLASVSTANRTAGNELRSLDSNITAQRDKMLVAWCDSHAQTVQWRYADDEDQALSWLSRDTRDQSIKPDTLADCVFLDLGSRI